MLKEPKKDVQDVIRAVWFTTFGRGEELVAIAVAIAQRSFDEKVVTNPSGC
jgi:hypothetical protein